jgi:hypothetical protein
MPIPRYVGTLKIPHKPGPRVNTKVIIPMMLIAIIGAALIISMPGVFTPPHAGSNANSNTTCPINSHQNPSDSSKCLCDAGYKVNSTGNGCVISSPTPKDICAGYPINCGEHIGGSITEGGYVPFECGCPPGTFQEGEPGTHSRGSDTHTVFITCMCGHK